MKLIDIKAKQPFKRLLPDGHLSGEEFYSSGVAPEFLIGDCFYKAISQADMIREYYPTSHVINDPRVYKNIYHLVWETSYDSNGDPAVDDFGRQIKTPKVYEERVPRYAFPFQQIIVTKRLQTDTGNDAQMELSIEIPSKEEEQMSKELINDWQKRGIENALYQFRKSWLITADAAFVGIINKGKFSWKILSYLNGDTLYPHYDYAGELECFARSFFETSADGSKICEWLEIWDDTKYYKLCKSSEDSVNEVEEIVILDKYSVKGFELVDVRTHGFPFIPIAYSRTDGPCWAPVQDLIDSFELAFSQMAHNNAAYGEPVMVLKTEGGEPADMVRNLDGTVKGITLTGEKDEVHMMQAESAAESYQKQLDITYKMIFQGSFTVIPPTDLKSGDTPGVTIKLLFTPSVEKGTEDASETQKALNDIQKIHAYGFGFENKERTPESYMNLPIIIWQTPYVHQNESALVADHVALVNSGIESKETAADRLPMYAKPGERKKVMKEAKEKQDMELLYEEETIKVNAEYKTSEPKDK